MATPRSQNGWTANDGSQVSSRQVPGSAVKLSVRRGPGGDLLLYLAGRFDREVEDIDNARGALDDWGYAERPIRGSSTELSNHASGTAIDLNAPRHPLGARGTFSKEQVAAIRRILADCGGVIRWGGDYKSRADEMHFELNDDPVAVYAAANRVLTGQPPAAPVPAPRLQEDVMYIKCQPRPDGPVWVAILSGPMFVGLSPGEIGSAEGEIKRGAICQWVERHTWDDLDRRSQTLCANPRPVTTTA